MPIRHKSPSSHIACSGFLFRSSGYSFFYEFLFYYVTAARDLNEV